MPTTYNRTVSGRLSLLAPLANGANIVLAYPPGNSRTDWSDVDVESVRITTPDQGVLSFPQITLAVGASLTLTNASGAAIPAGTVWISAKVPDIPVSRIEQANYDAMAVKERNRLYAIPSA
jgi:hypothetical protein